MMDAIERAKLLHQTLVVAQEHFDQLREEVEYDYFVEQELNALKTELVPARLAAEQLTWNLLHPREIVFDT
jgi:hypothetical protein